MGKADQLGLHLQLAFGSGLDRNVGEVAVGERDLESCPNHGLSTWRRRSGGTALGGGAAPGFGASRRLVFATSSLVGHYLTSRLTSVPESEGHVAIQQVLLRPRVRVGVLLRLALLPDVLRLPEPTAAVPAAEAAGGLLRRRRLRRRARV